MIVGSCARCGKTLYHDSRFVRDELHAYCADHAPAQPESPPVETATFRAPILEHAAAHGPPVQMGEEFFVLGKDLEPRKECSRCRLREPMAGADFCEWCAKDEDFDLEAISRQAGQHAVTATNTRDCPLCRKPVDRDSPQYVASVFRYHTACAYAVTCNAKTSLPNPKRLVTSKGIDENLAANEKPYEPLDCSKDLTGEDIDKMYDRLRQRNERAMERTFASALQQAFDRGQAAERLARLVLGTNVITHEYAGLKVRFCNDTDWDAMRAEARRVLGEKT